MPVASERSHRAPSRPLPPRAADCHMHVFGPFERFPLAAERAYTVPEALLAEHEEMKRAVGLERTVLLQASGHGGDNSAMLAEMEFTFVKSKTNIVIDHMGLPDAAAGVAQPGFQTVLRLLRSENMWVKLAGADRITRGTGRLRDAIPFIQALAAAAPERLVWGSDWPNIGFHSRKQIHDDDAIIPYRGLDAGELLDVLIEAVPDAAARRAILTDNPQRLYGFER